MAMNEDRAEWGRIALQTFGDLTMGGELSEETIGDLVCDICHFAELELGLNKDRVVELIGFGIGAWSAERSAPDGDPENNDQVSITFL